MFSRLAKTAHPVARFARSASNKTAKTTRSNKVTMGAGAAAFTAAAFALDQSTNQAHCAKSLYGMVSDLSDRMTAIEGALGVGLDKNMAALMTKEALQNGTTIPLETMSGLVSRVMTHKEGDDILTQNLSSDESQGFAFVGCKEWLHDCMGFKTQLEWLLALGYETSWLKRKINEDKCFSLLVFRPEESRGFPATWDNIFDKALRTDFPGEENAVLRSRVLEHREALKTTSFDEIEVQAKAAGLETIWSGKERNLTLEEYLEGDNTLVNVRRFLRKQYALTPLFKGDGFTWLEDGSRGYPEKLVAKSCVIGELPELEILRIPNSTLLASIQKMETSGETKNN